MLTQQLIEQLQFLGKLQMETFTKVINYAINFIINQENQMKINQFIEISEEDGEHITNRVLLMIKALVQYQTNVNDLPNYLKLLRLDKERREYLQEKLSAGIQQLRKSIFRNQLNNITHLKGLEWRFEVEVASKNYKNDFKPNILLNFKIDQGNKITNNIVNSDFANVKNLHNSLLSALKLHCSARFKTARNSSI